MTAVVREDVVVAESRVATWRGIRRGETLCRGRQPDFLAALI